LAQKRVRKKCFLTNSVMRSFSSIKIRKSPPPMYSMDNPVFDDNTSNNVVVTTSQPVHTRYEVHNINDFCGVCLPVTLVFMCSTYLFVFYF